MKRSIIYILLITITAFQSKKAIGQCPNGDLEFGNFSNWKGWSGDNIGFGIGATANFDFSTFTPGFSAKQTIVNGASGNDPISGAPLAIQGSYALKLGNGIIYTNPAVQVAAYTFTVDANFSFQYSTVMLDGHHKTLNGILQNPFFQYWVSTSDQLTVSINPGNLITPITTILADKSNPFFSLGSEDITGSVVYTKWRQVCMAGLPGLEKYIGKKVTIYFLNTDCSQGGHYAYTYIDGLCNPLKPKPVIKMPSYVCSSKDVIADASNSLNVTDEYWRVEKLSSSDPNSVITGTDLGTFLFNTSPGVMDIYNLYTSLGGNMTNGYYKVTLGVRGCGGDFIETSVVVDIELPVLVADDIAACCEGNITLVANSPVTNSDPSTFIWYDQNNNMIGSGTVSFFTFAGLPWMHSELQVPNPSTNSSYHVIFNNRSCQNDKWMHVVHRDNNFEATILPDGCACKVPTSLAGAALFTDQTLDCDGSVVTDKNYIKMATDQGQFFYTWTDETGKVVSNDQVTLVDPSVKIYTLTISNGCTSKTTSVFMPGFANTTGHLPDVYDASLTQIQNTGHLRTGPEGNDGGFDGLPNPTFSNIANSRNNHFVPPLMTKPYHYLIFLQQGTPYAAAPAYNAVGYDLTIFDRWGAKVFNKYHNPSSNPCIGLKNGEIFWDGYRYFGVGGLDLSTPVQVQGGDDYQYLLYLYDCNGVERQYSGHVVPTF